MAMAEGWKCPDCGLILAPSVTEHRCDGDGGVSARAPYGPVAPAGSVSVNEMRTQAATAMLRRADVLARDALPADPATTINVHVSGSLGDAAFVDIVRQVRRGLSSCTPERRSGARSSRLDSDAE